MPTLPNIVLAGLLAGAALLLGGAARAADLSPGYVGASYGAHSSYADDCGPACETHTSHGGKLYAGYTLSSDVLFGTMENVSAIELSAYRVGNVNQDLGSGLGYIRRGVDGLTLTHASALMLTGSLALDTRLGLSYAHARSAYVDSAGAEYGGGSHVRFGATIGAGLSYVVDKKWTLHLDDDYIPVKFGVGLPGGHVNMLSFGLGYHF